MGCKRSIEPFCQPIMTRFERDNCHESSLTRLNDRFLHQQAVGQRMPPAPEWYQNGREKSLQTAPA